ncbi:hypothetical protein PV689_04905 [Streptomyces sp. ATCC51928]|uniref:Type II secretion system protein GspF domain-containing protein n=1 Tax=Streptomyces caviscabies TaxID=90079 RepID=A0ABW2M8A8_9ACTN|nr:MULTISPECIES: hypothetical protein [unclassified Streptomyces]MDX3501246.1 hypothetical protein [Streptomyces sp. ATCC51928]MDX5521636.1 hypothetical protein [Streptomyces sp. DE06-01C]
MMKVLLGIILLLVLISALLAGLVLWSYIPFRDRVRMSLRAIKRRVGGEVVSRRRRWALRNSEPLLQECREVFPQVAAGRVVSGQGLTPEWVVRWWYAAQIRIPVMLMATLVLALCVWNAQALLTWDPHPAERRPPVPEPWTVLQHHMTNLWDFVQSWSGPGDVFKALRFLIVALLVAGIIPLLIRFVRVAAQHPDERARRARMRRRQTWRGPSRDDFELCWPVVVLVLTAVECGREYKRLTTDRGGEDVPRVSLSAVEGALWRSPRLRRGRARAHQNRATADHIGRVVGALRAAEAQQDSNPKQAMQDLTVMLLTIAERYAEGKVSHLLDDEQIGDAQRVVHREWVRLPVLAGVVVSAMAGAAFAGLPDAALTALLPLVVIITGILVYRDKGPSLAQLRDLVIPR